jgi:hypothetical protein
MTTFVSIVNLLASADPMIYLGLAVISAVIASYNIYIAVQEEAARDAQEETVTAHADMIREVTNLIFNEKETNLRLIEVLLDQDPNIRQILVLVDKYHEHTTDHEWVMVLNRINTFATNTEDTFRNNSDFDVYAALFEEFFGMQILELLTGIGLIFSVFFYWCSVFLSFCRMFNTSPWTSLTMKEYFSWKLEYCLFFIKHLVRHNYSKLKIIWIKCFP